MNPHSPDATPLIPWDPISPWPKARPWIWGALFVFVCLYQGPGFVKQLRPDRTEGVDFFQDWASAKNLLEGLPLYENHNITVERHLGYSTGPQDGSVVAIEYNAHPPPSVLLAVPFALVDYPDATLLWNLVSLAAFGLSVYLVVHNLPINLGIPAVVPFITLFLIFDPIRQQCSQGQLGFVLLLLITSCWAAARSQHCSWAGIFLGAAIAIKLFPAFLVFYFCIRRRWKIVAASSLSFVVLTALSSVILGIESYRTYFNKVLPTVERFRSSWINQSFPGLWTKLFDPETEREHIVALWRSPALAQTLTLISCLMVVAILLWVARHTRSQAEEDHTFGLAVLAMLLVSPITWNHYLVLVLLPVATTWLRLPAAFSWRAAFLTILAALGIEPSLLYKAIPGGFGVGVATPWQTLTLLSVQFYGLLGLFALGIAEAQFFGRYSGSSSAAHRATS
ncbi:MAG: glycosyltransferase family 87 protein [Gemmataceae bacterium]